MPRPLRSSGPAGREGFTLLELLIVVLLISLVLALVPIYLAPALSKKSGKAEVARLGSLVRPGAKSVELLCLRDCSRCLLRHEGGTTESTEISLPPLEVYLPDRWGTFDKADFGRWRDEKVCLRFRYFPNGSHSKMIVHQGERYYFLPAYFGEVRDFPSLQEAKEYWLRNRRALR